MVFRACFKETTVFIGNRGFVLEEIEWTLVLTSKGPETRNLPAFAEGLHLISRYSKNASLLLFSQQHLQSRLIPLFISKESNKKRNIMIYVKTFVYFVEDSICNMCRDLPTFNEASSTSQLNPLKTDSGSLPPGP